MRFFSEGKKSIQIILSLNIEESWPWFFKNLSSSIRPSLKMWHRVKNPGMKGRRYALWKNTGTFRNRSPCHRSARTLSGGEAQRTSLARAFAIKPEILFLDEPFASLDPPSRESLIEDLERILRETRTTTVFATHDRMEALRLSDRIAVMNEGRSFRSGLPRR